MKADDFKKLKKFNGKSSPATFINVVSNNLLLDFKRKKYGRRRFPIAVKRMGKWAEAVYRYVCWKNFSYDDAFDFLKVDNLFPGTYEEYQCEIEQLSTAPCMENPQFVTLESYHKDSESENSPRDLNPLDQIIEQLALDQRQLALDVIWETTSTLPETDRFIIENVYGSEIKLKDIARILSITTATLRTRLNKLLLKYRELLLAKGIRKS